MRSSSGEPGVLKRELRRLLDSCGWHLRFYAECAEARRQVVDPLRWCAVIVQRDPAWLCHSASPRDWRKFHAMIRSADSCRPVTCW